MSINSTKIYDKIETITTNFNYVAFFSNDDTETDKYNIASKLELFRCAVTPSNALGVCTLEYIITSVQSCPFSTVASVPSSTQITLANASAFSVGDRILIKQLGNYQKRKITAKTSNTITIDKALPYTVSTGVTVQILITMRAVIESGSLLANSGSIFDIEDFEFPKDSGLEVSGNVKIELTGS